MLLVNGHKENLWKLSLHPTVKKGNPKCSQPECCFLLNGLFHPGSLGHKGPQRITNWGLASITDTELEIRKKLWQERKNEDAH